MWLLVVVVVLLLLLRLRLLLLLLPTPMLPAGLLTGVPCLSAERQLKEDAQREKVSAEAEEHAVEEALRSTRQELATVSRELLDH